MVLHDQSASIDDSLGRIHFALSHKDWSPHHNIHTAPLIRKESDYLYVEIEERRKLFYALYSFTKKCDISWKSFLVEKTRGSEPGELLKELRAQVEEWLVETETHFQKFDKIIIYYDNGQAEISRLMKDVFDRSFAKVEIRKVQPADYSLFQSADLLCTLTLLREKISRGSITKSEEVFFRKSKYSARRNLKKNILKLLDSKQTF